MARDPILNKYTIFECIHLNTQAHSHTQPRRSSPLVLQYRSVQDVRDRAIKWSSAPSSSLLSLFSCIQSPIHPILYPNSFIFSLLITLVILHLQSCVMSVFWCSSHCSAQIHSWLLINVIMYFKAFCPSQSAPFKLDLIGLWCVMTLLWFSLSAQRKAAILTIGISQMTVFLLCSVSRVTVSQYELTNAWVADK